MSWFSKVSAKQAIDGVTETLKTIDGMNMGDGERAVLRKEVFTTLLEAQAALIQAELISGNALTRSWRPILMLSLGLCFVINMMAISFGFDVSPLPNVVVEMIGWSVFGLGALRSADKIVPRFTPKQLRKFAKEGIDANA